jgi:hypothetical protein
MGTGRVSEAVELKRGGKVVIPAQCRGPILVFVGPKTTRYRFRGVVHRPTSDKCVTYAKQNRAAELLEVLEGSVEVQYGVPAEG